MPRYASLYTAVCLALCLAAAHAQDAPDSSSGPMVEPASHHAAPVAAASSAVKAAPLPPPPVLPPSVYEKSLFERPMAKDDLAFLAQYDGIQAKDLLHDKQFRRLLKAVEPDCMFHYGRDMPLDDAMTMVLENSRLSVQVREHRYVMIPGERGPYLGGSGFLWFDMLDGIGVGAFVFHPTNGEPSPALNVFSRQVRDEPLALGNLPPAFALELNRWTLAEGLPPLTSRYFITGRNRKILLEHDENFCLAEDGSTLPAESGCEQEMADAADIDLSAAYYIDETHHATNATAWMLNPEQVSFIQVREHTCGIGPDPLGCRIRLTRERTGVIINRSPGRPGHI